jgi:hypothetical protein
MTPQQRVRNLLAEKGVEKTPTEIEQLFKCLYANFILDMRTENMIWDPEKVADTFEKKLKDVIRLR